MTTDATIAALQVGNVWLRAEVAAMQKTLTAWPALLERARDPGGSARNVIICPARSM